MPHLHVAGWSVVPFALLLLAIALLPVVAEKWWHSNLRKALVSIGLAVPAGLYLAIFQWSEGQPGFHHLAEAVAEYVDFVVSWPRYTPVAGGIAVQGQFRPTRSSTSAFSPSARCSPTSSAPPAPACS